MTRSRFLIAAAFAVPVLAAGCAAGGAESERGAVMAFSVGDCVSIPATTPAAPEVTRASKVSCNVDPSYTVGAIADGRGTCPSAEYQHLPADIADPSTARLCLVPNLVANHCYELGMPAGMVELADCAERGPGVLVQVTQRLDVRDGSACPTETGQYAWPYPSPARTYCTRTVY
ncbi:hypothetical protein M2272_003133 [Mycobacterium frederiksbergense]|jgi:hypothetical protein|uniref:Lipoprotein n=1 Tax=Mycolicibacterium frederiksbergense TaxID=117567 RepID=A0ABT6L3A0_9MYCO|nr:hypothetical protein [Mycolicibacterium frederiksbergense]MDH6196490.1 hypothetical protein [Mycolicibacterium frederiksbergense]